MHMLHMLHLPSTLAASRSRAVVAATPGRDDLPCMRRAITATAGQHCARAARRNLPARAACGTPDTGQIVPFAPAARPCSRGLGMLAEGARARGCGFGRRRDLQARGGAYRLAPPPYISRRCLPRGCNWASPLTPSSASFAALRFRVWSTPVWKSAGCSVTSSDVSSDETSSERSDDITARCSEGQQGPGDGVTALESL